MDKLTHGATNPPHGMAKPTNSASELTHSGADMTHGHHMLGHLLLHYQQHEGTLATDISLDKKFLEHWPESEVGLKNDLY